MMKQLHFAVVLALVLVTQSLWAQGDKTLVKTMDPKGTSMIAFDFTNNGVEAEPWDQGFIRVELEITANFPEAVLAQLIKAGRYTLSSTIDGEVFKVQANNLEKAVTIGGKDLDDQVRIFIKTPGYYAVSDKGMLSKNINGDVFAERSITKEEKADLLKKMSQIKGEFYIQYRFVYKDDGEKSKKAAAPVEKERSAAGLDSRPSKVEERALPPNATLNQVQERYGDIIIDGAKLDMD